MRATSSVTRDTSPFLGAALRVTDLCPRQGHDVGSKGWLTEIQQCRARHRVGVVANVFRVGLFDHHHRRVVVDANNPYRHIRQQLADNRRVAQSVDRNFGRIEPCLLDRARK